MSDHARITDALNRAVSGGYVATSVQVSDLRALLADLDAVAALVGGGDVVERCRKIMEQAKADERALWGVVHNAGRSATFKATLREHVMYATALGSSSASVLCARFGLDPDSIPTRRGGPRE